MIRQDTESGPTRISSSSASLGYTDATGPTEASAPDDRILPMALQTLTDEQRAFVEAIREGNRDEMRLSVVGEGDRSGYPELAERVGRRFADVLGIAIEVRVVAAGELDQLTEIETAPKPKRFKDERG